MQIICKICADNVQSQCRSYGNYVQIICRIRKEYADYMQYICGLQYPFEDDMQIMCCYMQDMLMMPKICKKSANNMQ